jgi:hypothetical protein
LVSAATSKSVASHWRAFILTASAIVAIAVALFSVGGASATSIVSASTTTTLSVSAASITAGATVTFKSTVTASDGTAPTGTVDFSAQYTAPGSTSSTYRDLAQANLVQGTSSSTASISTTTLQPGTYTITALYNPAGSVAWNSSTSGTAPLTVGSVQPATTSLSLTATAQTISADQSVTIKTTLSTAAGVPAPTGIVRFSAGPDVNELVTVGQTTVVNGAASLTQGGWAAGNYVLVAYYDGDGVYSTATSGQLSLTVTPVSVAVSTTTTVTLSPATIASGALVTIRAHVVKTGTPNPPPGGAIVSFAGGPVGSDPSSWVRIGMPGQTTLDANGNASETVGGWSPGQYVIVAQYPGDLHDANSSGQTILTVIPATGGVPQLTYTGETSAAWHDTATLSGTLTAPGGAPISGESVTFVLGSDTCTATSDANGNASCQTTVNSAVGPGTVVVASAGDSTYPGVRTAQTFTITARPTRLTVATANAAAGGTATLSATLTDQATSAAIAGETVSLTVGADTCTATTNASGVASCGVPASEGLGAHDITAAFGGDAGYLASSGTGTLTLVSPATTTQAGPVAPALAGSGATLTAAVTPAAATGVVTFSSGSTTLCSATLSGGAASCSASFAQTGSYTVTARYAGDGVYPSSTGTTTVLVYALAPGGGTFVVGDKSASGSVTFWGAQWAKINGLSSSPAPSAFKGFALNGATCGGTWSTNPGNSSPPPVGPLPAYMAVLVTSSSTKSGSQISGNVVAIVIVKTDAGYAGDPGHAGTGTVVATVCGG